MVGGCRMTSGGSNPVGNAVVVPVAEWIGRNLRAVMNAERVAASPIRSRMSWRSWRCGDG